MKTATYWIRIILVISLSFSTCQCQKSSDYKVETFKTEIGWGYKVSQKGKTIINQPMIPAINGNRGFATGEEADQAGQLVVEKLEKGQFPPSLSLEELEKLGVHE